MKRHLTLIGLLIVFAFSLTLFSGCAEKKAVVKDEALQEQQVATAQEAVSATVDDEAARKAKELEDREAALKAQAEPDAEARAAAAQKPVDLNLQNIYFDYDKSSIREDAREILKANAGIFTKKSEAGIIIEGHCDERGTAEYNMALGERRAQEAKQYLMNLGINASRMETISYGEERPLDAKSTEEAWAKNRRAQFLLK
jgi:peptidoglycan-associated lipoprotein